MQIRFVRPTATVTAMAALLGLLHGCSGGADNPKLAEAPAFTTPPDTTPQKIPNRKAKGTYGASSKYQEAMERAARGGR